MLCIALTGQLQRLSRSTKLAHAFFEGADLIPRKSLLRHVAEHVFRIRLFRPIDSSVSRILHENSNEHAYDWSKYARSESVHDRYYLRDLNASGLRRVTMESLAAFDATIKLVSFLDRATKVYGPVAVVLYSFWTEKNSEVGSSRIVELTRSVFGSDCTKGAAAHRALDEGQNPPTS
jgi:hypothetical protein